MPLYTYKCEVCSKTVDAFRKVDNRHDAPRCCARMTIKLVNVPIVKADIAGYTSPIDGAWIEGSKARSEDLKRNNCIPYDEDFKSDVLRNQNKLRDDTEKAVDRIVEETAASLGIN